jgi:predicted DNA-binding antitoxin AbrB/MazE fold protein
MSTLQHIHAIYEDGVLKPLEPLDLAEHQRVRLSVTADRTLPSESSATSESFFEAASRSGFIGCIKGRPPDLSTNKKYMEGFGTNGG